MSGNLREMCTINVHLTCERYSVNLPALIITSTRNHFSSISSPLSSPLLSSHQFNTTNFHHILPLIFFLPFFQFFCTQRVKQNIFSFNTRHEFTYLFRHNFAIALRVRKFLLHNIWGKCYFLFFPFLSYFSLSKCTPIYYW